MTTRAEWMTNLLADPRLALPTTQENVHALLAWTRSEFGGSAPTPAAWNPFASTQDKPGATPFNTFGEPPNVLHVWNYPDEATGVTATIETLLNGYYEPIVSALANGHDAQAVVDAVHDSPWGSKPTAETLAYVYNHPEDADLLVGEGGDVPTPDPGPAPVPVETGAPEMHVYLCDGHNPLVVTADGKLCWEIADPGTLPHGTITPEQRTYLTGAIKNL
jgi:hypothetical protein